jgi:uncharacterized membrane protein YfcA
MGVAMGALGIGAVPVLMTYFALCTDTPHSVAIGTTNFAMLPALATSSLAHWQKGSVQRPGCYYSRSALALGLVDL